MGLQSAAAVPGPREVAGNRCPAWSQAPRDGGQALPCMLPGANRGWAMVNGTFQALEDGRQERARTIQGVEHGLHGCNQTIQGVEHGRYICNGRP